MGIFEKIFKPGNFDNDMDQEFAQDIYNTNQPLDIIGINDSYATDGVEIQEIDKAVKVIYNGILAKGGADNIYAVVGYGNNLNWEDVEYYHLHNIALDTYELVIPVKRQGNINIAFKDDADNWDNNEGLNFTFDNMYF